MPPCTAAPGPRRRCSPLLSPSPPPTHTPHTRPFSPRPLQAAHPILRRSPDLQLFLEASETEFAIEMSRSQEEDPVAVQASKGSSRWRGAPGQADPSSRSCMDPVAWPSAAMMGSPPSSRLENPPYLRFRRDGPARLLPHICPVAPRRACCPTLAQLRPHCPAAGRCQEDADGRRHLPARAGPHGLQPVPQAGRRRGGGCRVPQGWWLGCGDWVAWCVCLCVWDCECVHRGGLEGGQRAGFMGRLEGPAR